MWYTHVVRPVLFLQTPEDAHRTFIKRAKKLQHNKHILRLVRRYLFVRSPPLAQNVDGILHANPVGLAAGFDKDASVLPFMEALGFGHLEVGSVTLHAYAGNAGVRLERLEKDKSLVVNYGLCNDGVGAVAKRLASTEVSIPYGVSIAKTPTAGGDEGIEDYAMSFSVMHDFGAYTTINISCPNVADGQTYGEDPKKLDALLTRIDACDPHNPVYLKLKPDYTLAQIDAILGVIAQYSWVRGVIVSNLTKNRSKLCKTPSIPGGLSGGPVRERSTQLIAYIYQKTHGQLTIIGCGGVMGPKDAYEKILAGASLIQLITGLIYEGPGLMRRINKGIARQLKRDGYSSIGDAVGVGAARLAVSQR